MEKLWDSVCGYICGRIQCYLVWVTVVSLVRVAKVGPSKMLSSSLKSLRYLNPLAPNGTFMCHTLALKTLNDTFRCHNRASEVAS